MMPAMKKTSTQYSTGPSSWDDPRHNGWSGEGPHWNESVSHLKEYMRIQLFCFWWGQALTSPYLPTEVLGGNLTYLKYNKKEDIWQKNNRNNRLFKLEQKKWRDKTFILYLMKWLIYYMQFNINEQRTGIFRDQEISKEADQNYQV